MVHCTQLSACCMASELCVEGKACADHEARIAGHDHESYLLWSHNLAQLPCDFVSCALQIVHLEPRPLQITSIVCFLPD